MPADDEDLCPECDGQGVQDFYVGTYGTSSCSGPAERTCPDCLGSGLQ